MPLNRLCLDCGQPSRNGRCPRCRNQRYGTDHQAERATWQPAVQAGVVDCWRCHEPITDTWDLGHKPDGSRHPEHAHCNRSAAARGAG